MLLPVLALTFAAPPSCCPSMSDFAKNQAFIAAHLAPLPFRFQSRGGKTVDYSDADGHEASGYYVASRGGVHTAIVMVHEWWGLNDYIKQEAVRMHDRTGYAVLAVDLYGGQLGSTPQEAGRLMQAADHNPAQSAAIVKGAEAALVGGVFGTRFGKLGTIGWCFGGGWSLRAAIAGGDHVRACVMYYGLPDDDQNDLARLRSPVLLIEALQDQWISPAVVSKFKQAMREAGVPLQVRTYEADHAFANPSNPHYDKADADDAMSATLQFYKAHLG